MTIPPHVIDKAIEGGWLVRGSSPQNLEFLKRAAHGRTVEVVALDPSFWQSLGKALGWKRTDSRAIEGETFENIEIDWERNAHRFYDLILTGYKTDLFWAELLG